MQFLLSLPLGHPKDRAKAAASARAQYSEAGVQAREVRLMTSEGDAAPQDPMRRSSALSPSLRRTGSAAE
eukprot:COSAG01_NODE_45465_length_409_cov_0.835484_1_plen_69_part_10